MADDGDNSRALLLARPALAAAAQRRRKKWEVEFARYFATPLQGPSTPPPPGLRLVSRGKLRHHGTWLPAVSPAAICVSRPSHPSAVPVLTVSIGDVVFEEHFVSILNFSWPQVTCMTQCPIRGSRVVFVSFCDKSKQIQKFALRFPQLSDAESFLNCVKECSSDTMDIIPSGSDYVCEDSSTSEYVASNVLHHRPDDVSSFEEPASDHRTEAPALCYHEEPDQPVPEPLLATNIDNIYSGFPPSFTDMLTNCSTKNKKVYALDTSHEVSPAVAVASKETTAGKEIDASKETTAGKEIDASKETTAGKEIDASKETTAGKEIDASKETTAGKEIDASKEIGDIMARIKTYMADGSFHDMLFKLDKVIDELGGGFSL